MTCQRSTVIIRSSPILYEVFQVLLRSQISFLGHIITKNVVQIEKEKISVVQSWPTPLNVKELKGFLGVMGYYRRFVKDYGLISRPQQISPRKMLFNGRKL